jgi:hypothetical protein
MITNAASHRNATRRSTARHSASQRIATWGQFLEATVEERRQCMKEIFDEWEQNHARELAEDERGDSNRGHWGD